LGKIFVKLYEIPYGSGSSMKDIIGDFTLIPVLGFTWRG
jgi:hypothetical protein